MTRLLPLFVLASALLLNAFPDEARAQSPISEWPNLATLHNFMLAKVYYSNFVTLRPGSLYELRVHFEQNGGIPQPTFNYMFQDTGLGAAEPLYPVFQSGYQDSWAQLISSADPKSRHLDHFSEMKTPEGCKVVSVYIIRSIDAFPDLYQEERAAGYDMVDISWDYTIRTKKGAECGRHRSNDPDANFDPTAAIMPYLDKFHSMGDIPASLLAKYEAKVNLIKTLSSEASTVFDDKGWATYEDSYSKKGNSLWYYPDSHAPDYSVATPRPQPGLTHLNLPRHFVLPADAGVQAALPLSTTLTPAQFGQLADMLKGQPVRGFDPASEPGHDDYSLKDVTTRNVLTSGLKMIPIQDPAALAAQVLDPSSYRLVEAVIRPYEDESDVHFTSGVTVPEVRLIYQLHEQVFVHLTFDAVDRLADPSVRAQQHQAFLAALDELTRVREAAGATSTASSASTAAFLKPYLSEKRLQSVAFSSSLAGIWVFGQLTRAYSPDGALAPDRLHRHGIDYGYYSTAYDNELLRAETAKAKGARQTELQGVLDDLTPRFYRDPRRMDTAKISFGSVTCAQCHQMSGRDGVHVQLNDHLDSRFKSDTLETEYLYRELDRQLRSPHLQHAP